MIMATTAAVAAAAAPGAVLQPHGHIARHDVQRLAEMLLNDVQLATRIGAVVRRQIGGETRQILGRIATIARGQFGTIGVRQHGGQLLVVQPRRAAVVAVTRGALAAEQVVAEHRFLAIGARLRVVVRTVRVIGEWVFIIPISNVVQKQVGSQLMENTTRFKSSVDF